MSAPVLLDSDMLSEIMKARDPQVLYHARRYLGEHEAFRFSILTRYEVLRGLYAKNAPRQIADFLAACRASIIYPLTEEVIDLAAQIYGSLHRRGKLINEGGDTLIAATAILQDLVLVTGNEDHFERIEGLRFINWRKP